MNDNKHLCVFGVLKTEEGLKIKEEMLEWLNPLYNVLCIEQDPPGTMFEYPAIKYALQLSIDMGEPVLYIHTKGAANKNTWYQKGVRNIWKNEFSNKTHVDEMFNLCENVNKPLVVCPFTGKTNITWFNAFIVNSEAAEITLPTLKTPTRDNRWYYECIFNKHNDITVIGTLDNECNDNKLNKKVNKMILG